MQLLGITAVDGVMYIKFSKLCKKNAIKKQCASYKNILKYYETAWRRNMKNRC